MLHGRVDEAFHVAWGDALFDLHGSLFVALLPGNWQNVLPSQTGHQPRPDQPQSGSIQDSLAHTFILQV